jgi:hypothetical protein
MRAWLAVLVAMTGCTFDLSPVAVDITPTASCGVTLTAPIAYSASKHDGDGVT